MSAATARMAQSRPAYEDALATVAAADGVTQYVYSGGFPFVLAVMDETVVLGVTDDASPTALLETTDDAVRQWAETTLDRYREAARPLGVDQNVSI